MQKMNRIMVDMSATLLHHGHIKLLKKAKKFGFVIVALTTDKEIKIKKGYKPELSYNQRKEILLSIKYVDAVVPSPWQIDNLFLKNHQIDYLVHGNDNSNLVPKEKLILFDRTKGVSSQLLRKKVLLSIMNQIKI
jgi:glycerol-3-phosphate cytidylyltransferase